MRGGQTIKFNISLWGANISHIVGGLEKIKLGKPCQLLKSNEKNKKLCTKVDSAHFVRCIGIKIIMQSKQNLHQRH